MSLMKKVNALVLGLAVLLAAGCSGDEKKKDDPAPVPAPESPAQTNCLVTTLTGAGGYTHTYIYNGAGQISRIDYAVSPPSNNYHHEITYNAAGNISEKKHFNYKNEFENGDLYTYNGNGLPDKVTHYLVMNGNPVNSEFHTYTYNAAKQVVKLSYFSVQDTVPTFYKLYSYPGPNRVVEKQYQKDRSGNFYLSYTISSLYDDKKHPFLGLGYYYDPKLISTHNVLEMLFLNKAGQSSDIKFTYVYNADGYPVQQTDIVNGNPGSTTSWTYNCQ